jgi:hypothetical protein
MLRAALALLALTLAACGPKTPPRGVLEHDLGTYHFRRYQQVYDVEVVVPDNPAVGHTGTYVRGGDNVRIAPVFVTRYAQPAGIAEALKATLKQLDGYRFELRALHGERVYDLRGEHGDAWLVWVSGRELVKLGVPQGEHDVPSELVEPYLKAYPSELTR